MTLAKTTRDRKIKLLISKNIEEDGYKRCADILNKGGFTAPCGRKHRWTVAHVKAVIRGEVFNPFTKKVSSVITEHQHKILDDHPASIASFVREAISEKISRDNLTKGN